MHLSTLSVYRHCHRPMFSHSGWDSFVGLRVEIAPCCTPGTDVLVGNHMSGDDLILPTAWPLLCRSFFFSSSTNEFSIWLPWGPNLLLYCHLSSWVLPWRSKCLSWILNEPQDHLHASWSTAMPSPGYCSAGGLLAPSGWMGFESAGLWVQAEILAWVDVWSWLVSHVLIKPLLSVFVVAKVASKLQILRSFKIAPW